MTDRKRVLLLISGFAIGQPLGGAERFGVELARHLDQTRYEPIVCGFWHRGVPAEAHWRGILAADGVETFEAVGRGRGFTPWRFVRALRNVRGYLAGRPVDVIHSQFQLGSVVAILLKEVLGAKILVRTAHNAVPFEWGPTLQGFFSRQVFTRWVFPLAFDAEAGVSRAAVESQDRRPGARLARKHAYLIHNGIRLTSPAQPAPDLRTALGLAATDTVIGSVGRFSWEKGYSDLLQAAPAVLAHRPDVKFLLVGDGPLREKLQQQTASLGLTGSVIFTGVRQDVPALYGIMDLFVLPSLFEGLPTVILESMAAGVPVVATATAGAQELIDPGRSGWLCPMHDPIGLADTLLVALGDAAKRMQMADVARTEVAPRYSLDQIADQYESLYESLVGLRFPIPPHNNPGEVLPS